MSFKGFLLKAGLSVDGKNARFYNDGDLAVNGAFTKKVTVSTIATVGNVTYTIAQLLGGLIKRDPAGGARSDVTPTAALIVAGIFECQNGDAVEFALTNTADAAETITVTAGTGVTLDPAGTFAVAQNQTGRYLAVVTDKGSGSEAVTVYSLGVFTT